MWVDTHCHLDLERFAADLPAVVERAVAAGVELMIVPALDPQNWHAVLELARRFPPLYAAVGVHPNSCAAWDDGWLDDLRALAAHPKVVAIGEIGLDYYWDRAPRAVQKEAFARQLGLAASLGLPAIVHCREAEADLVGLLARSPLAGQKEPGVWHSFAGTWAFAQQALELGFYLGFTGPVTYKRADELRRVAARMPAERLLVETDAPFLPPQPVRGQRNEPAFLVHTAARLAVERGLEAGALARQTTENARRLFARLPGAAEG